MSRAESSPLLTFFRRPRPILREDEAAFLRQWGIVKLYPGDSYELPELTIKAASSRTRDLLLVGTGFAAGAVAAVGGALAFIASLVMWG